MSKVLDLIIDLPFEDYMQACYDHAVDSKFFFWFPETECLVFAQAMWAKRYWMHKNGHYNN